MNAKSYMQDFTHWAGKVYEESRDSWTDSEAQRYAARLMLGTLAPKSRVLDIGTGRGRDVELLATAGHDAVGLDLTLMAEWAEIRTRHASAAFKVCAFLDYTPNVTFDAVLDSGCFHHQHPDDIDAYLSKIDNLLTPTGALWLNVFRRRADDFDIDENPDRTWKDGRYLRTFKEATINAILRERGFAVVSYSIIKRVDLLAEVDDMLVHAVKSGGS